MFLASDTGGQFAVNTNNFDRVFDNFNTDFRSYYSLGYSPPHPGNGREYRIKVKIKDKRSKGVHSIRFANSYRDKSPAKEMEEATFAGLQYGIQSNALGIRLRESQRIPRSDGTFVVHVDVLIALGKIAILPRSEDMHVAKLQIWVQARDDDGGISQPRRQDLPLTIPTEDIATIGEKYYAYTLPLVMAPGNQWISVGVRDELGGETSVVTKTFRLSG